jgi:hypothetical protein
MNFHRLRIACAVQTLLALLIFPAPGSAQNTTTTEVKISGMGIRKCAEWEQWKEAKNGEARALTLEWAQGFIAGHNVYIRSGASPVIADSKVLLPLIDSYCGKNPETPILSVIIQITQSLGGTKILVQPKAPAAQGPQYPQRDNKTGREL